jgi:glycosyltransferase involved in cell wall biosynthesis
MIKVSIIVPVYKAEKYISKCIESLVVQTIKDIEIILVDDGSPDNSGKICDEYSYKDNRIKVVHKVNGGVSSARNNGIKASIGEYILFVDSDDWVENNYVEALLKAKAKYPDSEPLCGFRTVSDYNGTLIANNVFSEEEETEITFDKYMLLVQGWLAQSPCNKLFDASIIKENNLLFDT